MSYFSKWPLPYGFISLDESQLQQRRHLLDFYGQSAQLSAFLVILASQLPSVLGYVLQCRSSPQKQGKEHVSPIVSRFEEQSTYTNHDRVSVWRRLNWFLDQHIHLKANGPSWGTWRVLLIASIWNIWLCVLAVNDTGDGMSIASPFSPVFSEYLSNIHSLPQS